MDNQENDPLYVSLLNEAKDVVVRKASVRGVTRQRRSKERNAAKIELYNIKRSERNAKTEIQKVVSPAQEGRTSGKITTTIPPWQARAILDGACSMFRSPLPAGITDAVNGGLRPLMSRKALKFHFIRKAHEGMWEVGFSYRSVATGKRVTEEVMIHPPYREGEVIAVAEDFSFSNAELRPMYLTDYMPDYTRIPKWVFQWYHRSAMVEHTRNPNDYRIAIRIEKAELVDVEHPVDFKQEGITYLREYHSCKPNIMIRQSIGTMFDGITKGKRFKEGKKKDGVWKRFNEQHMKNYRLAVTLMTEPIEDIERYSAKSAKKHRLHKYHRTCPRWLYTISKVLP